MDLDTARRDRAEIDRAIDGQTVCSLFQVTLKVRRRTVHDKYRALNDAMYAAPPRSDASPAA